MTPQKRSEFVKASNPDSFVSAKDNTIPESKMVEENCPNVMFRSDQLIA